MSRLFANNRATTLSAGITAGQTNIPITNGSAFPEITGADTFFVTLDDEAGTYEILLCTAHSAGGTTLTCTRGQDGTPAQAWPLGTLIEMRVVAAEYREFVAETDADVNLQGNLTVNGAVSFSGGPLDVPSGGTGKTSHTSNALLVGAGALDIAELLPAGDGTPVHVVATTDGVAWASQSTETVVTKAVVDFALTGAGNALDVAQGGTGRATLTAENVLLGDGANDVKFVAPGASGNVLTSNGTTWQSTALPDIEQGYQVLTTSGAFVVPAGVSMLWLFMVGGGAGGYLAGGGAGSTLSAAYKVTGGEAIAYSIGAGGAGGLLGNSPGSATTFGNSGMVYSAAGGTGDSGGLDGEDGFVDRSVSAAAGVGGLTGSGGIGYGSGGGAGSSGTSGTGKSGVIVVSWLRTT